MRVTDETGFEYYYMIDKNGSPSQMIAEEMGEGKIKVEFVDYLHQNGPTCDDIFAPS